MAPPPAMLHSICEDRRTLGNRLHAWQSQKADVPPQRIPSLKPGIASAWNLPGPDCSGFAIIHGAHRARPAHCRRRLHNQESRHYNSQWEAQRMKASMHVSPRRFVPMDVRGREPRAGVVAIAMRYAEPAVGAQRTSIPTVMPYI